jgi:hypothetical protein
MRHILKYMLGVVAARLGVAIALFEYSTCADQQRFSAAKNDCERACIQDSGGLDQCRAVCVDHPNRYP